MLIVRIIMLAVIGLASGLVTATGLFALISSIGLINRYADVTNTKHNIILYEEMIIMGAGLGNIWDVLELPFSIGVVGLLMYGLFSGIFIGTFLICLAETVKALPIVAHRARLKKGLGFAVFSIALGKFAGHMVYYLLLYK